MAVNELNCSNPRHPELVTEDVVTACGDPAHALCIDCYSRKAERAAKDNIPLICPQCEIIGTQHFVGDDILCLLLDLYITNEEARTLKDARVLAKRANKVVNEEKIASEMRGLERRRIVLLDAQRRKFIELEELAVKCKLVRRDMAILDKAMKGLMQEMNKLE